MDLEIKGKSALVMGASTGIGRAIAQALVEEGVRVAICARNEGPLTKTATAIGAELSVSCDLTNRGAARTLVRTVSEKFGGLDILVCNTGGPPKGDFMDITPENWNLG